MRVTCLVSLTAIFLAQGPPSDLSVRELLVSHDPAQLAWGAELAARSEGQEFVPEIRRLLGFGSDRVKEHALDALIRLSAKVPEEELAPLSNLFTTQKIILAARNGHQRLLLSLLHENESTHAAWVALNESLDGGGTYWPDLLREWTIHVVIYVTDPGRTAVIGPFSGGGFCGDSFSDPKFEGYPARATYRFYIDAMPGDVVFQSRPHPVYYRRSTDSSGCDSIIDRDDYRADFVSLNVPSHSNLKGHLRFDLSWPNDEAYIAEVSRLRKQTLADYQEILGSMVQRHMIPPEDVVLRPHIVVQIEDQRSNKARELPATPPWE